MSFGVGQYVYVSYSIWGPKFRAVIQEINHDTVHMVWADNGLSVTSFVNSLTLVPPLQQLAEVAE